MYKFMNTIINVHEIRYIKLIEKGWSSPKYNGCYMPTVLIQFMDSKELRLRIEDSDIEEYRKFEKYILEH